MIQHQGRTRQHSLCTHTRVRVLTHAKIDWKAHSFQCAGHTQYHARVCTLILPRTNLETTLKNRVKTPHLGTAIISVHVQTQNTQTHTPHTFTLYAHNQTYNYTQI